MSNFKIIIIGVFVAVAVIAVLSFSGIISLGGGGSASTTVTGTVTVWGTFGSAQMSDFINDFNTRNQDIQLNYVEKDPSTFAESLVEAIASGQSPDLVILPDNLLYRFADKLTHIPYTSLPEATFQNTFISGANIFLASDGSLAIPWAADPLVMYYNRDMLEGAGIAQAPATWTDFAATVPELTKKDQTMTISQSAAALGTYKNIAHANDLLALLFMQGGNTFITAGGSGISVHFGGTGTSVENTAAVQALNFYTAFANPVKDVYSWNNGLPLDHDDFVQSSLAYYFGYASELPGLRAQNPNLNFGVALPPQSGTVTPFTTGTLYGLAIPKSATNQLLSYTAATLLANAASESALTAKAATTLALMPVRRDVLAEKPVADPYLSLFYDDTLVLHSWFNPDPNSVNAAFSELITNINSGLLAPDQALLKASSEINSITQS